MPPEQRPARQAAMLILLALLLTSALSTALWLAGSARLSGIVCLGGIGVCTLILVIGGVIVGRSRGE
jgi:O-antigen ligase